MNSRPRVATLHRSFLALLLLAALSFAGPATAKDDKPDDELENILGEDDHEGAETTENKAGDGETSWFDHWLVDDQQRASLRVVVGLDGDPGEDLTQFELSWSGGKVSLALTPGDLPKTLTSTQIFFRPVGARAEESGWTLFLPADTNRIFIKIGSLTDEVAIDLSQFVVIKPTPVISDIIVVGNQTTLAYPFKWDRSDWGSGSVKTRRLIVTGENLREALNTANGVGSPSKTIEYSVAPGGLSDSDPGLILARGATEAMLFQAKAAKEPNQALIAKLEARREGLASADDLLVIDAKLKPGVTPGFKPLLIGEAQGSWPLLFGDQEATLQFVRHDDFVRTDSVPIFYAGDIGAVDLIFKTDIPFDSIGVRILHRPAQAKEGEEAKDVGVVLARRMDEPGDERGPPIFRTDPIHFISDANPLRRPPENEDALYVSVLNGDRIGARLLNPARAKTQPPAVVAEIYGDPGELGELWKSALKRVADCDGDKFDGDPKYALKKSTRVERILVSELATYDDPLAYVVAELTGVKGPKNFGRSVTLYKGDHAAALLIRDELVNMMAPLGQTFLPLSKNINGEATALRKWAVASGQSGSLPVLSRFKTTFWVAENPYGETEYFSLPGIAADAWPGEKREFHGTLAAFINRREEFQRLDVRPARFDTWAEQYDAWLDQQIQDAALSLIGDVAIATGHADKASACSLLEMIVIAGQKAGPVVERIVPRLVKKVSQPVPLLAEYSEYWVPDKLARGYVERMHIMAEAVAALDQYSKIDDAYKAMALAVVTVGAAAGVSALGFGATAAGLLIVGDVADAAYFGAKGLESAIESEAFYEFAAGASLILGDELLLEAESQRETVGMALVGLIAPGIGAGIGLKDLRYFKNINKGRALLKAKGVGVLDDLDSLAPLERAQVSAYLDDMLAKAQNAGLDALDDSGRSALISLFGLEARRAESGINALSEADQASLRLFDENLSKIIPGSSVNLPPSQGLPYLGGEGLPGIGSRLRDPDLTPANLMVPKIPETVVPGHPDQIAYVNRNEIGNNYFLQKSDASRIRDPDYHVTPSYKDDIEILDAVEGTFSVNGKIYKRADILNPVAAKPGEKQAGNFANVYDVVDENGDLAPFVLKTFGEREGWMTVDEVKIYGRKVDYEDLTMNQGLRGSEHVKYASLNTHSADHLEMMDDIEYGAGILEKADIPQLPIMHVDYSGPSPVLVQRRLNADLPPGVKREAMADDELLRLVKTEGSRPYTPDQLRKLKYYAQFGDDFAPQRRAYLELRRKMADAGIVWEDGHFGNVFFQEMTDGSVRAAILDTDRMGYVANNLAKGQLARKGRQPATWMDEMKDEWLKKVSKSIDRDDPHQMTLAALLHKGMFRIDPITGSPIDGLLRIEEVRKAFPEFNQFFPP